MKYLRVALGVRLARFGFWLSVLGTRISLGVSRAELES